jgi:tryptophan synthase alpha chain
MQLMTHVIVGYPNLRETERIVAALAAGGSDLIELQIPFSDPVADGPTIAAANDIALKNGLNAKKSLTFAAKMVKKHPQVQFYFMSYLNPVLAAGGQDFFRAARRAGICGFIIPDLPVDEFPYLHAAAEKYDLNLIAVLAPNTASDRIKKIVASRQGFVYCPARLGVTGKQTAFSVELKKFLARVRKYTKLPLAVGFGVEKPTDIQSIQKAGGQIAVVGSALIRTYTKGGVKAAERLVRSLKA